MPKANGTTWDLLLSGDELRSESLERNKKAIEKSINKSEVSAYLADGWKEKQELKTKTKIYKDKAGFDAFEDRIWMIFYRMGFTTMNKGRHFHLSHSNDHPELTKQLDVIAIDDETCLFVECKAADKEGTSKSWQKDISEMEINFGKFIPEIRKQYPNVKCKYIFAVSNYVIGDQDKKRLDDAHIVLFDDNTVLYYEKLVDYLGSAAKYQLLGSIFAGQDIANMNSSIPAIKGTMGKTDYYSFLMKPSDLLKIGYVLHRTNANNDYDDLMPSYQRLIKKERLNSVRKFVNEGGYFPNSLIISIDVKKGKKLQFDYAGKAYGIDSLIQMGTLHLPAKYQSAYIIDGQHRLYGFSDSEHADDSAIPVVAFENLSKENQLRLFMEINENQKAVSKALRNILEIEIFYEDKDVNKRKKALLGKLAKHLGEEHKSPLNGRVIIGEDAQTAKCCITIDYIKAALEKTNFFNKYKKNGVIIEKGWFDNNEGKNDQTFEVVYPLLRDYLNELKSLCPEEWDGYVTKNNAIVAVIRILDDIISIVSKDNKTLLKDISALKTECAPFISALGDVLRNLPSEIREKIRSLRGEAAKEESYRTIQMSLRNSYSRFTNDNIEKYYIEKYTNYASNAIAKANIVLEYLKQLTKKKYDGPDWEIGLLEENHVFDFTNRISRKEISNKLKGITIAVDKWSELNYVDYSKIINSSTHWSDYYKDELSKIGITKNKNDFISQLKSIGAVVDRASNGKSVTLSEFNQIIEFSDAMESSV